MRAGNPLCPAAGRPANAGPAANARLPAKEGASAARHKAAATAHLDEGFIRNSIDEAASSGLVYDLLSEPGSADRAFAGGERAPREGCVMRSFILAICCAAAMALMLGSAHAQTPPEATPSTFEERPPPPTEPSIPTPASSPAAKPKARPANPVVPRKTVQRPSKGPTGPVTMPAPDVLVMMVRSTLVAVNQANFTGNYSVLRGLMTPALQARASAAQFAKAFANLREQNSRSVGYPRPGAAVHIGSLADAAGRPQARRFLSDAAVADQLRHRLPSH